VRLTIKSWVLLGLALVLGAANLVESGPAPEEVVAEGFAAVLPHDVQRVEISSPVDKLILERGGPRGESSYEKWKLASPIQAEADAAQITALLKVFAKGISMEARVDEGNLKNYGLEDQDARLVELFTDSSLPAVSVMVGKNTVGSMSFVRRPGEDLVYRADVGGRARYEKSAADWRNRQVLDLDPGQLQSIRLTRGSEKLVFTRGKPDTTGEKPRPGAFVLEGQDFPVDAMLLEALAGTLCKIRVGSFQNPDYDGGFSNPAAVVELVMSDTTVHTLTLGSRSNNEASFIKIEGVPEILRVSSQPGRILTQPLSAFQDRSLWHFRREEVESIGFTEAGLTVVLQPVPESRQWVVLQPANLDVDPVVAEAMLEKLKSLRGEGEPLEGLFLPTGAVLTVQLKGGAPEKMELGQTERDAGGRVMVRIRVGARVVYLKESTLLEIKRAFGRGS
jgi:hypothetical protein